MQDDVIEKDDYVCTNHKILRVGSGSRLLLSSMKKSFSPRVTPYYSSVVDDSDFKQVNEDTRISVLNGLAGGSSGGIYDFNSDDDMKNEKLQPTDIELAVREGRLTRAQVSAIENVVKSQAEQEFKDAKTSSEKKAVEEKNARRQAKLDEALGVEDVATAQNKVDKTE